MMNYYTNNTKRDLLGPSVNVSSGRKKIKDYSYSTIDRIGKGFSSIVYKGVNDRTSKLISGMIDHASFFLILKLFQVK